MDAVILALIIALFVVAVAVWAFAAVASLLARPPHQDSVYCMELALKGQYNSPVGPCAVANGEIYYLQPGAGAQISAGATNTQGVAGGNGQSSTSTTTTTTTATATTTAQPPCTTTTIAGYPVLNCTYTVTTPFSITTTTTTTTSWPVNTVTVTTISQSPGWCIPFLNICI